jgi:tetratricopeptide (TPR) repeat protein
VTPPRRAVAALLVLVASAAAAVEGGAQEPGRERPAAFAAGLAAVAAGDDAGALDRFEAALAADPDDLRAADQYRKAVIRTGEYDRGIAFFDELTAAHPDSAHAWLNYGYAYVDKIPAAGAITQVILASEALARFSRSLEIERSWLALYTRGNSYLYWPKIFGRAPLGVADLEAAVAMVRDDPAPKRVYVRSWIALGDGYWKTDRKERARETWREALARFPGDPRLEARLALDDGGVDQLLYDELDPNRRVDTDLEPLWAEEPGPDAGGE